MKKWLMIGLILISISPIIFVSSMLIPKEYDGYLGYDSSRLNVFTGNITDGYVIYLVPKRNESFITTIELKTYVGSIAGWKVANGTVISYNEPETKVEPYNENTVFDVKATISVESNNTMIILLWYIDKTPKITNVDVELISTILILIASISLVSGVMTIILTRRL